VSAAAPVLVGVLEGGGEPVAEREDLFHGYGGGLGVLGQPRPGGLDGGEEVDLVAEGGAHEGHVVGDQEGDHRGGGLHAGDPVRFHGQLYQSAGGVAGGGHVGGAVKDGREHQGVQGAPGVELASVDGEVVRGGVESEAAADDAAGVVVLGVGQHGQRLTHLFVGGVGGVGELAGGDGPALAEEPEQGRPQPGTGLCAAGGAERRGEAVGKLTGSGVHDGVPFVAVGQEAQQESRATSRVKVWAASFNPSAMVRYGHHVLAICSTVIPACTA